MKNLSSGLLFLFYLHGPALSAAPFPAGTHLSITPGQIDGQYQCVSGSCFSMQVSDIHTWVPVDMGIDAGIIIGKNQLSGGQEAASSSNLDMPGEISSAWLFFSNYGTFSTAPMMDSMGTALIDDASLNIFDDTSCSGVDCIGKTQLGTWHVAWNGLAVPMGSQGGCNSISCSINHSLGIFVSRWTVNPDMSYSLDYSQVVPDGHPSGFGGIHLDLHLEGIVTPVVVDNFPPVAENISLSTSASTRVFWQPQVSDEDINSLSCYIDTPPVHGVAEVLSNCQEGSYMPEDGFSGNDSFTYRANDGQYDSNTATVNVNVADSCASTVPLQEVTTIGSGQSSVVNETLRVSFIGRFTTTQGLSNGGKNTLRICGGTTGTFEAISDTGSARCTINSAATASTGGRLAIGDKLVCTNKPDAGDTDRFRVKLGN